MLQINAKRNVTVCAGCGRTGKSTFAVRYLLNAPLDVRFVFDPEGEYSQRLQIPIATSGYDLSLMLCKGWVLFGPHQLFPGRLDEAFKFFCEWSFDQASAIPNVRAVLVVDEVWRYANPQNMPIELSTVVQTGSKRGLGLLCNTQIPNKLNGAILNECSEFVCYRLNSPQALATVEERGFNPEEVSTLPNYHFISRTDIGDEVRGKIEL